MANSLVQEQGLEEILPGNTVKTQVSQAEVAREVKPAPPRYRNELSKYIVHRSDDCIRCGNERSIWIVGGNVSMMCLERVKDNARLFKAAKEVGPDRRMAAFDLTVHRLSDIMQQTCPLAIAPSNPSSSAIT